MKTLLKMRAAGNEPDLVALNLTGKAITYPGAYVAEPNGKMQSLYAANVVVLVDDDSFSRGVDALHHLGKLGITSWALAYLIDDGWEVCHSSGDWIDVPLEEKRIGIYTEARLRELAGDDWPELQASPEMLKTFAYLCQANMEAA